MPHFVIDCSKNIMIVRSPEDILDLVYKTAESTGLFAEGDIKVRINFFKQYKLGEGKDSFIHVFGHIMEGRTITQKSALSKSIITSLKSMFPEVPIISLNITDFEKETYCNKSMV